VAVTDQDWGDDESGPPSPAPWYNRTPAVVGASVLGLALIGILVAAVTFVSRQFNEPEQAPLNFVAPSFSATAPRSSTPTTTATITSTSAPATSDIDTPSSSTTSSSGTSGSATSSSSPTTTAPTQGDEPSTTHTTRRGPRTNVTRTLYPQP
jgi:cytoskeletal protein RodZ